LSLAVVFPGQGSHHAGMASELAGHPAYATFDEVGRAAGLPQLAQLADDPVACRSTAVAQPAVFAASVAAWRVAGEPEAVAVAGHSLGEWAAAVAAGALTVADAAAVVAERGRAFADACAASPGTMAAVLALDLDTVRDLIAGWPGVVVANDNAPGQVVIAGPPDAVDAAAEACRGRRGRVRRIDVEGAFHTPAMAPAVPRVAKLLAEVVVRDPVVPMVSGATATAARTASAVASGLVDGILAPVRWREVQLQLAALGATTLLECGPGDVLRGLARRTIPEVATS
jgi:[acyl-carrier-protein] S-malonyltransferase